MKNDPRSATHGAALRHDHSRTVAAFVTHSANEVAALSDYQVFMLEDGAREWIAQGQRELANGRQQLSAVQAEIRRRGIVRIRGKVYL